MPCIASDGVSIHYEVKGGGSPVLLLAGLAGVGASWGPQIDLFAAHHQVIVPDHRGTGASEHTARGMTIAQHALDMVRVIEAVGCGPVHAVGSSTGGAIVQWLAIHHRERLRSATILSSIARADAFYRRQFDMRRRMLADSGLRASTEANALFLFDPEFQREHPEQVQAWVNTASACPFEPEIVFARIDMIAGHDAFDALPSITTPTLVLVGERDFCAPPYFSEELAGRIPGAEFAILNGGHFIFVEKPVLLHDAVEAFIARHQHG
ncbi:putative Hydrolase, alpha/beta hydrolase fold family (plasmid) [Cupriavidus taiwanensis]|uniref:Putative Hydrolase, alpha/beta hydrolase fold family n=1 Tax=Cupriavidus taiwanensis TaxID=164546 RepID=A0A7Z7JDG6_9BURK|nr:putative Hydrolase, alpha/beta hydrolase fold family [Cupriavidus taiwanensis]SOZ12439.1 putative Hydrolase, alpha/beta hydrolase fold family [Cupriavidus taiwanensis]SOZ43744.1 putative Hydrolase, alpha/beta hydrolase fold family [Cupriavidus taiwanensis]SPC22986.1 putative Hydrolase, alpha/beta hydrolase fold family [Cupriavidus taiwanensis]SPD54495.1 putative Hydrolase, alpha/beta hydrolase fold family [Cupriavidus taiwanensis]